MDLRADHITDLSRMSAAKPRLPLAALVPLFDVAALVAAVALSGHVSAVGGAFAAVMLLALRSLGTHAARINPRLGDDVGRIVAAATISVVVAAPFAGGDAATGAFLSVLPWTLGLLLPGRGLAYSLMRAARARGFVVEPTLIIGAGQVGLEVVRTLQEHPEYGLVPVGFLDSVEDEDLPLPLLGRTDDLEPIVREFAIDRVIVAFGITREPDLVDVIRAADRLPVEVHLVPRFFELGLSAEGPYKDDLWGIPLVRLRRSALRTTAWRTKRIFDLIFGTALFLLTLPLFGLAALAVRLSSPGPIFFRQERIGQHGELFGLLKFRTLRLNPQSDTQWNVDSDDDRLTTVGKILRRTSLDELPQFINVLRGQMSLIGPRPERPHFVDRFTSEVSRYGDRHRVPVGITGWAQVHGLRGDTSIPERVRFDNYYIEHWSLWRDLVITVRTVWLLATGRH